MIFRMFLKPEAFAEISRNIAEVIFASIFISSVFDRQIFWLAVFGFIASLGFWITSVVLSKE